MEEINLWTGKRCRACLQHSDHQMYSLALTIVNIQEKKQIPTKTIQLVDIYYQCTQLHYDHSDLQWEWICLGCYEKLIDFFKFRNLCIDSFNKFKENDEIGASFEEKFRINQPQLKVEVVEILDYGATDDDRVDHSENVDDFWQNEDSKESTNNDEDNQIDENKTDTVINNETVNDATASPPTTASQPTTRKRKNPNFAREIKSRKIPEQDQGTNSTDTEKSNLNENEQMITCSICSKKFFKKHRFDAHMRKHNGLKQWQCAHCEKSFEKYYSLKTHIAVKHYDESEGRPEFICDIDGCGKSYSLKDSLRVHMLQTHIGKKKVVLPTKMCELCGKSFKNNNALLKHSYTHTKITPHKCHVCSKMFATSYKLKEHIMRHDGIKNFICPTCGLRKTTGHELRVHMKYHSTDLKFPCELCSLVFTRQANMKRHMKIVHCGIKSFPCPHCDRSFGKAETLKHHIMTHTGERPLACSICDRRFIQPVALKTHMKVHNKNK